MLTVQTFFFPFSRLFGTCLTLCSYLVLAEASESPSWIPLVCENPGYLSLSWPSAMFPSAVQPLLLRSFCLSLTPFTFIYLVQSMLQCPCCISWSGWLLSQRLAQSWHTAWCHQCRFNLTGEFCEETWHKCKPVGKGRKFAFSFQNDTYLVSYFLKYHTNNWIAF